MNSFFVEAFGDSIGPVMGLAATIVLIAIALWVAWLILKRFKNGLFISGGPKGRAPRLAVIDAVPVDSHRRMVLVRRDDVEHLIMIGGPTDIVVETGISKSVAMPAQPATLPQAPRLPVQNTQPPALPVQPQRSANMAARDAVIEAERGRPIRSPENSAADRRSEPAASINAPSAATQPVNPQPSAPPPTQFAPARPAIETPESDRKAQPATLDTHHQPATEQVVPSRSARDFDMDSLISDLKFNPAKDR